MSHRDRVGRRLLAGALALALAVGCSSNSSNSATGGSGGSGTGGSATGGTTTGGTGTGGSGTGGTTTGGAGGTGGSGGAGGTGGAPMGGMGGAKQDASPATMAPKDCRGLRECVNACAADKACAQRCVSGAPKAAQSTYAMIVSCMMDACPTMDHSCRCDNECFDGGKCTSLVIDQCDDGSPDTFCDPAGADCGL